MGLGAGLVLVTCFLPDANSQSVQSASEGFPFQKVGDIEQMPASFEAATAAGHVGPFIRLLPRKRRLPQSQPRHAAPKHTAILIAEQSGADADDPQRLPVPLHLQHVPPGPLDMVRIPSSALRHVLSSRLPSPVGAPQRRPDARQSATAFPACALHIPAELRPDHISCGGSSPSTAWHAFFLA